MTNEVSEGGFLITKIHHLGQRIFSRILQDFGIEIGPGQGRVIFALWKQDRIPISQIAKRTDLGKSTLTETLDRLEDAGYIERVPSSNDRRVTLIQLTTGAKELHSKYNQVSNLMTDIFYKDFTNTEVEHFENTLKRILENLKKHESPA